MLEQFKLYYWALANRISNLALDYIPRIGHALVIVLVAAIVAAFGRRLVQIGLRAVGFDVFLGRLGIDRLLEQGKISRKPSQLVGALFYGLAWFMAVLMALDVLGLETASLLLENLAGYLPRLLTAVVMLGLGLYAVDFIVDLLKELYLPARPALTPTIVACTRWGLTLLVVLAVTEHLGIARSLISLILTVVLGGATFTLVLAFGIGGIDSARNVLAGCGLRRQLTVGAPVIWDGQDGHIKQIGLVATEFQWEGTDEIILVPNGLLLQKPLQMKH